MQGVPMRDCRIIIIMAGGQAGIYIPRFRNVGQDARKDFLRGYALAAGGNRGTGIETNDTIGAAFKESLTEAGPWSMWMTGMGECLPDHQNKVTLSKDKKDAWGMPLLEIDCEYKANELSMLKDILNQRRNAGKRRI